MKDYLLWDGRMNRMRFWVCKLTLYAVALTVCFEFRNAFTLTDFPDAILSQFLSAGVILISLAGGFFFIYLDFCWTIQRFHDHGKSGTCFLWLFVPLVNIYWYVVLLFFKGTQGPNDYGSDPLSREYRPGNVKSWLIRFIVIMLGVSFILFISDLVSGEAALADIRSIGANVLWALFGVCLIVKSEAFSESTLLVAKRALMVFWLFWLVMTLHTGYSWIVNIDTERLIQSYEIEY